MGKISIYFELFLYYIVFLTLVLIIPGSGVNDFVKILLTVSSFLFAIILGFTTANRRKRLELIRTTLRSDDARLLSIYISSKVFGKAINHKVRTLIENYLMASLDYALVDYNKSSKSFLVLYEFIINIKTKSKLEEEAKKHILDNMRDSMKNQKEVIYAVSDTMLFFEWAALYLLTGIIISCLLYVNNSDLLSVFVIPILCLTLVLLLLIVRDLNGLRWQEDRWIWAPLMELYTELDLLPYVIDNVINDKRLRISEVLKYSKKYRLASFPNKYPDNTGKTIVIIDTTKNP